MILLVVIRKNEKMNTLGSVNQGSVDEALAEMDIAREVENVVAGLRIYVH